MNTAVFQPRGVVLVSTSLSKSELHVTTAHCATGPTRPVRRSVGEHHCPACAERPRLSTVSEGGHPADARDGYFPQDWSSLPAGTPSGGRVGLRLELAWLDRAETPC